MGDVKHLDQVAPLVLWPQCCVFQSHSVMHRCLELPPNKPKSCKP